MKKGMKKILKYLGIIVLIVLVLLLAYIIYLFASYHRIPDNQPLQVEQTKESISSGDTLTTEKEYSALTYNIGFGAYTPDFSFFMDGGKSSWAKSKESVKKTVQSAGELVASKDPDFALIEEVDLNSTRSYHVDEYSILKETIPSYNTVFAQNYDSAFLFYPLNQPHGKSRSGLALFSKYPVTDSLRRSFPVSTSFSKFFDLDRCYSVSKIPVSNGKALCLYNLHLSAYTSDGKIADEQLELLLCDMQAEYEAGNYVIGGGDFNKDLLEGGSEAYFGVSTEDYTWAQPLRFDLLEKTDIRLIAPQGKDGAVPTVRNADGPYHDGQLVLSVDGFLVSPNVEVTDSEVVSTGFAYSDHNPICMSVTLLAQ